MKEKDKSTISLIFEQCLDSFSSCRTKCSKIFDILNQLDTIKRINWEEFELPEVIKESLIQELEMLIYEQVESLHCEIEKLRAIEEAAKVYESLLQTYCSSRLNDVQNPCAFECLHLLSSISLSLSLIVGMKQASLHKINFEDSDSFKCLKELQETLKSPIQEFKDYYKRWKEKVYEINF